MKPHLLVLLLVAFTETGFADEPLIVHEWGTFTVLQDENGDAIPGINVDDEPVPSFVHRVGNLIQNARILATVAGKSTLPPTHPDVRMRLETPVTYFYPPDEKPIVLDVTVEFPGGWLTEYYPNATAAAPNLENGSILPDQIGRLEWKGLRVGGDKDGPQTDSPIWLAPRRVDAASVETPDGETERYLFYRGVANFDSPVRVTRAGGELSLQGDA